jgi:hypothetical protein
LYGLTYRENKTNEFIAKGNSIFECRSDPPRRGGTHCYDRKMALRAVLLIFSITLTSCNFFSEKEIKERVDEGIQMSNEKMSSDIAKAEEEFNIQYKKALLNLADSIPVKNLANTINQTRVFIDTLEIQMNNIAFRSITTDVETELIREMFSRNGAGDSLFYKLKSSFSLARDITSSATDKADIQKSANEVLTGNDINKFKRQYFNLNSARGVHIILYGCEIELLNAGIKSLKGYKY